jgi:hypothetical protein
MLTFYDDEPPTIMWNLVLLAFGEQIPRPQCTNELMVSWTDGMIDYVACWSLGLRRLGTTERSRGDKCLFRQGRGRSTHMQTVRRTDIQIHTSIYKCNCF